MRKAYGKGFNWAEDIVHWARNTIAVQRAFFGPKGRQLRPVVLDAANIACTAGPGAWHQKDPIYFYKKVLNAQQFFALAGIPARPSCTFWWSSAAPVTNTSASTYRASPGTVAPRSISTFWTCPRNSFSTKKGTKLRSCVE